MIPSRRCFVLLTIAALVFAAGALVPSLLMVGIGLDVIILSAAVVDGRRARAIRIVATRRWPDVLVQRVSATIELDIEIVPGDSGQAHLLSNTTHRRDQTLVLRETLHPALAQEPFRRRIVVKRRRRLTTSIIPSHRGEHLAGPLVARLLGPWGLAWGQSVVLGPQAVRVYPQIRWTGRVGQLLALAHRNELGAIALDKRGAGGELYALRRYRAGDSRSRIHWKATARRGHLVTREDAWERGAPLLILLDCGRAMTTRAGGLSKLDRALAAALVLVRVAASRGDRVGVLAVSDRVERQVQVRAGPSGLAVAYRELYDLEARPVETLFDLATETILKRALPRATVVVFTSISDLAVAELLLTSLRRLHRRHRPMLMNLEDPAIRRLAEERPRTEEEAFAQLSSLEILLRNRSLGQQLRHSGIPAVTAPADRLALEALESYFELLGGMGGRLPRAGRRIAS